MMEIARVPMWRNHFTALPSRHIRAVVLHSTADRYPGDYGWLRNGGGQDRATWVSVHYYITKTGAITQFVEDRHAAWHAGPSTWEIDGRAVPYHIGLNLVSIGIELENLNTGRDPYPAAQYDAAVALTRQLVTRYRIPRGQVVRHRDIAPQRKTDPAGFPWVQFLDEVLAPQGRRRYITTRDTAIYEAPAAGALVAWGGAATLGAGSEFEGIDQQNGWVWRTDGIGFVQRAHLSLDIGAAVTLATSILHAPRCTQAHAIRAILARPHGDYSVWDIAQVIVPAYFDVCAQTGVDPLIAIAQMVLETGNLTSSWSQRPRRNPAGIGVTGAPGQGVLFATWKHDAIPAHVGRLLAYASAAPHPLVDKALSYRPLPTHYRGSTTTVGGLAGTWAADPDYAQKLCRTAQTILEAL